MERAVSKYLTDIVDDAPVTLGEIRDALLRRINGEFTLENTGRKDSHSTFRPINKIQVLDELTVVRVLLARHRIVAVDLSEGQADDMTLLAMYVEFGEAEGVYTTSEAQIKALASDLKPSMTATSIDSVYARLRVHAPVVRRTTEPHLIPVANGVFDHARQVLRPFSPDWVFLSKLPTSFDPDAESPVIVMPDDVEWDVESWISSLSDDEGVPELLWEVISAAVRSYAPWDKAIWFAAERGNNGKGTLVEMLRNVLGTKACSAVKFADFGHEFKMESLVHARVNLVDENDVGDFFARIADWKAAITGDVFTLNRKYKTPVAVRFLGIDIQCFNSNTPRTKDRSESFYRRLLIVQFKKWFGGDERKYIKLDYLKRPEVLRYVLKRALEMQHTKLSNPKACQDALDDYRGSNNMLMSFWREFEPQLTWDLVPFGFLHALYSEWSRKTNPSGQPESVNALISFLREHLAGSPEWEHKGSVAVRPKRMMSAPEPLISEYGLVDWMNSSYTGSDPLKRSVVSPLKVNYKGLVRRRSIALAAPALLDEDGTA
ncbi:MULTISPECIES: phage/plasmid primase, P4 family [unclassified Cryobacterium]|uniref:DNA primase family protein n=1 Tax=unclassified Cryobacterium TaxID=2649013 RepID=UPI00141B6186|nr:MULTISPECIES: phage/plasmid primase, P4 family [unclassified Cryobacterium]